MTTAAYPALAWNSKKDLVTGSLLAKANSSRWPRLILSSEFTAVVFEPSLQHSKESSLREEVAALQTRVWELERSAVRNNERREASERFAGALALKLAAVGERVFVDRSTPSSPTVCVVVEGFDADRERAIFQHRQDLSSALKADCGLEIEHAATDQLASIPETWEEVALDPARAGV